MLTDRHTNKELRALPAEKMTTRGPAPRGGGGGGEKKEEERGRKREKDTI